VKRRLSTPWRGSTSTPRNQKKGRDSLEDLLTIAQEIRELELHYRDNRIYIERFLRDMLEQLRSTGDDTADTGVCSPDFVESLKFIER